MNLRDNEDKLRSCFQQEASLYDEDRFGSPNLEYYSDLQNRSIHRLLGPLDRRRVLDVGCGTGRIAIPLAQQGAEVFTVDLTDNMILTARRKAREQKVASKMHFTIASARHLPFRPRTFDALTTVRMLHLIPKDLVRPIVEEMAAAVRPGGTLVIEVSSGTYGLFGGLLGNLSNLRLVRARRKDRSFNRVYFVYPWEIGRLFGGLGRCEVHGVYLPYLVRIHRLSPRLAEKLTRLSAWFPMNYLSRNLLVRIRLGGEAGS